MRGCPGGGIVFRLEYCGAATTPMLNSSQAYRDAVGIRSAGPHLILGPINPPRFVLSRGFGSKAGRGREYLCGRVVVGITLPRARPWMKSVLIFPLSAARDCSSLLTLSGAAVRSLEDPDGIAVALKRARHKKIVPSLPRFRECLSLRRELLRPKGGGKLECYASGGAGTNHILSLIHGRPTTRRTVQVDVAPVAPTYGLPSCIRLSRRAASA